MMAVFASVPSINHKKERRTGQWESTSRYGKCPVTVGAGGTWLMLGLLLNGHDPPSCQHPHFFRWVEVVRLFPLAVGLLLSSPSSFCIAERTVCSLSPSTPSQLLFFPSFYASFFLSVGKSKNGQLRSDKKSCLGLRAVANTYLYGQIIEKSGRAKQSCHVPSRKRLTPVKNKKREQTTPVDAGF